MSEEREDGGQMIGVLFSDDTYSMRVIYTNWKGERALRRIRPVQIYFGSNEWHPVEQWLMDAIDLDKGELRAFAMKDMERP